MKILCIGRNYRDHAKELGNELPTEPLFFMKGSNALMIGGGDLHYPLHTEELHYETELVLRIGKEGSSISKEKALEHIEAVGLGFDLTARDLQRKLKEKGHPWEKAKAFDDSAPVSQEFIPFKGSSRKELFFRVELNGVEVQKGDPSMMLFPFDALISYLSSYMTLEEGDLIFTGTPEGVGELKKGDRLEAFLNERSVLQLRVF